MSSKEVTVYPSAARTATPTPFTIGCGYARGVQVVVDLTAFTTAASLTVTIDAQDVTSGKWYNLLTSTALAAVATTVLRVYPGLVAVNNLTVNDVLAETIRVTVTHGNANSTTYSVSAHLIQ